MAVGQWLQPPRTGPESPGSFRIGFIAANRSRDTLDDEDPGTAKALIDYVAPEPTTGRVREPQESSQETSGRYPLFL